MNTAEQHLIVEVATIDPRRGRIPMATVRIQGERFQDGGAIDYDYTADLMAEVAGGPARCEGSLTVHGALDKCLPQMVAEVLEHIGADLQQRAAP